VHDRILPQRSLLSDGNVPQEVRSRESGKCYVEKPCVDPIDIFAVLPGTRQTRRIDPNGLAPAMEIEILADISA